MAQHEGLELFTKNIRIQALEALGELGFDRLGGVVFAANVLGVLYDGTMNVDPGNPQWEDRDYFVMSKGYTGLALYVVLALESYSSVEQLLTINTNGIRLPNHPNRNNMTGVDMGTGSPGQGMSAAIDIAYGNGMLGKDSYTYLLLDDDESREGQVQEEALYTPQHRLSHLIAFLDCSHQQLDGYTKDIYGLGDMRQEFQGFSWYALEVNGRDVGTIYNAIALAEYQQEKSTMIVPQTRKGKSCFFAKRVRYNRHMRFSKEQCEKTIAQLEKKGC